MFKNDLAPGWMGPDADLLPIGISVILAVIALCMTLYVNLRLGIDSVRPIHALVRRPSRDVTL